MSKNSYSSVQFHIKFLGGRQILYLGKWKSRGNGEKERERDRDERSKIMSRNIRVGFPFRSPYRAPAPFECPPRAQRFSKVKEGHVPPMSRGVGAYDRKHHIFLIRPHRIHMHTHCGLLLLTCDVVCLCVCLFVCPSRTVSRSCFCTAHRAWVIAGIAMMSRACITVTFMQLDINNQNIVILFLYYFKHAEI